MTEKVLIMEEGGKYHKEDEDIENARRCRPLANGVLKKVTKKSAEKFGYDPCLNCYYGERE